MDNLTDPIQETRQFYGLNAATNYEQLQTFELSPNEFTANDEMVGLYEEEVEPYEYLTIEKQEESTVQSTEGVKYNATCEKNCIYLPKTRT